MSEWVSVKERLPVNYEIVLLINHDEGDYVITGYCHDGDWYAERGESELIGVSNWQPLPAPPQPEVPVGCNMEQRTVYCNSCPCLFKDYQIDETTGETTGIWWTCGIDRFEIEFGNIPQNRVCRKSGCPLKRIELIGGTIIRPDERAIW